MTTNELYVDGTFRTIPKHAFDGLQSVQTLELQRSPTAEGSLVVDPEAFLPFLPSSLEQVLVLLRREVEKM